MANGVTVSQKTIDILNPIAQWSGKSITQLTAADVNRYKAAGSPATTKAAPTISQVQKQTQQLVKQTTPQYSPYLPNISSPFTGGATPAQQAGTVTSKVTTPATISQRAIQTLSPIAQYAGKGSVYDVTPADVQAYQGIGLDISPSAILGGGAEGTTPMGLGIGGYETVVQNGQVLLILRDANGNIIDVQNIGTAEPEGLTDWQKAQIDLTKQQMAAEAQQAAYGEQWKGAELALQQQMAMWQQQESERQYKAQLAAQPRSWLEYAAYTGQQPIVQPWMLPLMPEEYGFNQLPAGGAIPGWTAEDMSQIPELLTPSAQYMARMGPTAQQQYFGYQQAQRGATPEETQWRLWSQAPPGGRATTLYR